VNGRKNGEGIFVLTERLFSEALLELGLGRVRADFHEFFSGKIRENPVLSGKIRVPMMIA